MTKREIDFFEYSGDIMKALKNGVLITAKDGDRVNSMTISWGAIGIEWAKPIFITFVRESRYTRELLDSSESFTVNIPLDGSQKKVLGYMGTKSGRDTDKIKDMGLTLVPSDVVDAPAVKELPLTLECRIVHRQLHDKTAMTEDLAQYYPIIEGKNEGDYHIAYYGIIEKAYIIED